LSFRSLLYGMLLNSGNDAAYTIAQNYSGGLDAFVVAMNNKAISLGLLNTHFTNPAGFDSLGHYSSAEDLAKIATIAIENPQLSRVVSTKETSVASIDKSTIHSLKNLNKLLDEPGVLGIKTGTTPLARENLVGLVERNGHKILTVVLGSNDRFGETNKLLDWTYSNFVWK
ncbi:MAG: D-alanyl-D-alanine carboxypeptidase, partial [Candidatus Daviesbacteria bacterium]|nr:D-alanyl-D-alanine carboxypeptidase [Candidatus Daviesbacteria bacterium]